jgi:hypothetical protein
MQTHIVDHISLHIDSTPPKKKKKKKEKKKRKGKCIFVFAHVAIDGKC